MNVLYMYLNERIYKKLITFLKIYKFIYLFINFWLCWVFVAACGPSLVAASGGYSLLQCATSHCSGFSCCGARALGTWASVVVAHGLSSCGLWALERRLSSCGTQASLLRGMWNLPRPGLGPCPLHWQVDS